MRFEIIYKSEIICFGHPCSGASRFGFDGTKIEK